MSDIKTTKEQIEWLDVVIRYCAEPGREKEALAACEAKLALVKAAAIQEGVNAQALRRMKSYPDDERLVSTKRNEPEKTDPKIGPQSDSEVRAG